jgi:hypothetical protein
MFRVEMILSGSFQAQERLKHLMALGNVAIEIRPMDKQMVLRKR